MGASFRSGGREGSEDSPAEGPHAPFSCMGKLPPTTCSGEGGCYCLHVFFQAYIRFRLGQDGAGEPQSVTDCGEVCYKNKEPIQIAKEKEKNTMKNSQNMKKK